MIKIVGKSFIRLSEREQRYKKRNESRAGAAKGCAGAARLVKSRATVNE